MYRVEIADKVLAEFQVLGFRAVRKGQAMALATALDAMDRHLQTDPLTWGDPLFSLQALRLMTYHRGSNPISVHYAVDDVRKIVYVKSVRAFPGGGLESVP